MATATGAAQIVKPHDDDAMLVARARGDPSAFAPLYDRYFDAVYGYCVNRLGDRDLAEDATSLVFARALAGLAACRPASFRSWLFAIAHNTVNDCHRRQRPARPLEAADNVVDPSPTPEELAVAAEQRRSLHGLLTGLPEDQRRVMDLRLAGLSSPEVARVLGRSPTAIRSLQFRAVARLRSLLGHDAPREEANERVG